MWELRIMADLSFAQALILAAATGAVGFGTATFSGWVANSAAQRREDATRAESRRAERLSAYSSYLAAATELDARFDLFTPTPGQLGRAVSGRRTVDEVVRSGEEVTEAELLAIRGPMLISADLIAPLKEAVISANGLSAMVAVVGSTTVAQAARDLALEQRRWLLALERDNPAAAAEALAAARPALRAFERAAQAEAHQIGSADT